MCFIFILLFIITPTSSTITSTTMVDSALSTLFKIMDSMSSDRAWKTQYPNPCKPGSSWTGIECKLGKDNHFHVTRLDFGSSPNPSCKPNAVFPSDIFHLPYLQSVFFFNCFTDTKTTISVPVGLVLSNSSLEQLSFRSNPALVGSIPAQLGSLGSLQILTLSQNPLTGSIPVEVFGLSSLVHLDLSYNMLNGAIPSQVGNLRNLVGLDLSYNSLTGSIPTTIGELDQLQKLDLSSNSLVGRIPSTIEKLTTLSFIALSNNNLRGALPIGLTKLVNLQYFIMEDNPMSLPLPNELGMLLKLQELRLANSGFTGPIPLSFSRLLNLTTLCLENNRLSGEIPTGFGSLPHIYHMNLSRNLLGGVVPFNGSFLKRLGSNLDLRGNPGLCLNISKDFGVKIGVDVCEEKQSSFSVVQPLKKNGSSSSGFRLVSSFGIMINFLVFHLVVALAFVEMRLDLLNM
ncbi:hypothetical protein Droror1_Dr00004055 [Drosera rotundifolia]